MTEHVLNYDHSPGVEVQSTYYWCGPTSTEIVLNGRGVIMSQQALANELGTTTDGTAYVGLVETVLNRHLPDAHYQSVYIENDPPTLQQREALWSDIVGSINAGYGCVVNICVPPSNYPRGVKGSASPAYSGGTVYHYIAPMGYDDDPALRAVWIADPGFRPFGYWVALDQLVTMIPPKGYTSAHPVPIDPVEELMATNQEKFDRMLFELTNEWPDLSMYRTTNDAIPGNTLVGAVLRARAFVWDNRVEACAERGEKWAIDLVKACVAGTTVGVLKPDGTPDQFLIDHAKAVLAKVPKS